MKQWYIDNREKELKRMKQWSIDNEEKLKKYRKQYRLNNPDYLKQWRKNHPSYDKQWRKEHLEYYKQYHKNRRKTNLKFNLNYRISAAMRQSLKGNKNGHHWENIVNYNCSSLRKRLDETIPKGYTWQNFLNGDLHIDHIIPIRAFIFDKPEDKEFKECWNLCNLRLLTKRKNLLKNENFDNLILLILCIKMETEGEFDGYNQNGYLANIR